MDEMDERDYGPDYRDRLKHKYSAAGRRERFMMRLNRHRPKWYLIRGMVLGVILGILIAVVVWGLIWG